MQVPLGLSRAPARSTMRTHPPVAPELDGPGEDILPQEFHSPAAPRPRESLVWNADITRGMRTLLHALPLFRLHHSDTIVGGQGGEFAHYDAFAIAFRIFDLVIENTGLENEPEAEDIPALLGPTLAAMDEAAGVAADPERHLRMGQRVVDWLTNLAGHGEPYAVGYTDFDGATAKRRSLSVEVLGRRYQPGGRIVPRLSAEITNLYLSALNLPIEDQQIAVEAVMSAQIRRGSFSEALRSARHAHATGRP
jgi:hypothetical protein